MILKLLIIYEENTKEISTVSVIRCFSNFLRDFYGLGNVDLQNNFAIELMKWFVFEDV